MSHSLVIYRRVMDFCDIRQQCLFFSFEETNASAGQWGLTRRAFLTSSLPNRSFCFYQLFSEAVFNA